MTQKFMGVRSPSLDEKDPVVIEETRRSIAKAYVDTVEYLGGNAEEEIAALAAKQQDPEFNRLIASAARATEVYSEDELEEYAEQQNKSAAQKAASYRAEQTATYRTCGVPLPLPLHQRLVIRASQKKRSLRAQVLQDLQTMQRIRTFLKEATNVRSDKQLEMVRALAEEKRPGQL